MLLLGKVDSHWLLLPHYNRCFMPHPTVSYLTFFLQLDNSDLTIHIKTPLPTNLLGMGDDQLSLVNHLFFHFKTDWSIASTLLQCL